MLTLWRRTQSLNVYRPAGSFDASALTLPEFVRGKSPVLQFIGVSVLCVATLCRNFVSVLGKPNPNGVLEKNLVNDPNGGHLVAYSCCM